MSHFDQQLKATLGGNIDVNDYSIVGKAATGDNPGGDVTVVGGAAASNQILRAAQQQDRYTGAGDFGVYSGTATGTAYVAADVITMSDGSTVTVGSVNGGGDILTFIVTTSGGTTITTGVALTQTSVAPANGQTGFTLTPEIGNVTGEDGGDLTLTPGAGAGSGVAGEVQLGGTLNVNDFNITSPEKTNATDRNINIFPGEANNDETAGNNVNITGGSTNYDGGLTVAAGDVNITGGGLLHDANNATGGSVNIVGASLPAQTTSDYLGQGGGVNITAGNVPDSGPGSSYAYGGHLVVQGGDAYSANGLSIGGSVKITTGSGWDDSGNIILQAGGNDSGAGATRFGGAVILQASDPSAYGVSGEGVTALRFMGLQSNSATSAYPYRNKIRDNYIELQAPDDITTAFTLTLPVSDSTGTQALVSDGSGTLSWSTIPAAGGDVSKVGTPVNNQIGVWTGDGTLEGDANFSWDGSVLDITGTIDASIEMLFTERAAHNFVPVATRGILWVRNDDPNIPVFTDDAGTDHDLIPATGSWTPVVSDGTNDCTMTNQSGTYTKIGNLVFITCYITINSVASAAGAARITGLPFTAANVSAGHDYPLSLGEMSSLATATNLIPMAQVENNTAYISLHVWQDGGAAATTTMTIAQVSNGGTMKISGHYEV